MFFLLSGGTCSCLTASGLLFPSPPTPSCPEAFTVCTVSTDTTLRFQEIPQYTPETDTRARGKFNSPLPNKKSSKASSKLPKCSEQVSRLPAPNTNGYCQSYLSRNQVSGNENTTGYRQFHLQIPSATQPKLQPGLKQKQLIYSYSHR